MTRSFEKIMVVCMGLSFFAVSAVAVKHVATIDKTKCNRCGKCVKWCPNEAILKTVKEGKITSLAIDATKCAACSTCIKKCPLKAMSVAIVETVPGAVAVPAHNNNVRADGIAAHSSDTAAAVRNAPR
jgi:MinD superfamily P-loop ATPase